MFTNRRTEMGDQFSQFQVSLIQIVFNFFQFIPGGLLLTLTQGFIDEDDFSLLRICDQTDEVVETIQQWYSKQEIVGRKALST